MIKVTKILKKGCFKLNNKITSKINKKYCIHIENYIKGYHINDYVFSKDKIAFVHIPKTGGTTIAEILHREKEEKVVNLGYHRPVSLKCPPEKYKYITFIRNPIKRVWSYYCMSRRKTNNPYHDYSKRGIEVFLKNCWECRNMMSKYISGVLNEAHEDKIIGKAVSNLKKIYFIGLFSSFEKSIRRLSGKLKIDIDCRIPHNRNSNKPPLKKNHQRIINHYNQLDARLYKKILNKKNDLIGP